MSYQDTWATCTQCGKQFIFRVEDQRRQARRGEEITPPEQCPSCQTPARRETRSQPRPKPAVEQETRKPESLGPGPHEGHVKWYDGEKGYGFIIHQGGEEVFFHRTGIAPGELPDFPDGTRVTYVIEQTEKGPQAIDVERMDVEEQPAAEIG
jgi:CspA family cold shock protein